MDKITFDFEKETMELQTDAGSFTEHIRGLAGSRDKILASAGIAILDLSEMKELVDQLTSGDIDEDEFLEKSLSVALDAIKSRFHENLN